MNRKELLGATKIISNEHYTPLTYIESTGEQYINLNYIVQEDDVIEMYYIMTSSTAEDKALFGVYDGNGNLWASIYSNTGYFRFGNSDSTSITNARMKYHVKLQKENVNVGGTTSTFTFSSLPTSPLYIFARNSQNTTTSMYCSCKTFGFTISKITGEIVMNLKPCKRNSDNKIGMLDTVSGIFFINQGDGIDFKCGNEIQISSDYQIIDYVTFTKDNLFDLGIIKSTYQLEVLFQRNENSTTPYLYGCVTSPHTASVTAYLANNGAWRFGAYYKGLTMNNISMHRVQIENGKVIADFTSSTFTKSTFTTPNSVVLGGYRSASNSLTRNFQGKVWYFRISENNIIIFDLYPCKRISDGVEGFWDCVSQSFIEPF